MNESEFEYATISDLTSSDIVFNRPADVLELVGSGIRRAIILDTQLHSDFFDLSTGFAGEVVQKCVNYGLRIAVVATQPGGRSTSYKQFAAESTRQGRFVFVDSIEAARAELGLITSAPPSDYGHSGTSITPIFVAGSKSNRAV